MHTLVSFFGWPNGSVWGNLLAALVVWVLTRIELHRMHKKHEAKLSNQLSQEIAKLKDNA